MVRGRLVRTSKAALVIAVTATLLAAQPTSANAETAPPPEATSSSVAGTMEDDASIMALVSHRCLVIGRDAGYEAVHCADLDRFTNSAGQPGIRGQVQSLCQRASDGVAFRCRWIEQEVRVVNRTNGQASRFVLNECWYSECQSGRLKALSPGLLVYCGHTYYSTVHSSLGLPDPGANFSMTLDSYYYTPTSNCIRA